MSEKDIEKERQEILQELADSLHKMAKAKESEAEWYRTSANHLITGKWDHEEFIEKAEEKVPEMAENLPEIPNQ